METPVALELSLLGGKHLAPSRNVHLTRCGTMLADASCSITRLRFSFMFFLDVIWLHARLAFGRHGDTMICGRRMPSLLATGSIGFGQGFHEASDRLRFFDFGVLVA
jgi:hypothetical protein